MLRSQLGPRTGAGAFEQVVSSAAMLGNAVRMNMRIEDVALWTWEQAWQLARPQSEDDARVAATIFAHTFERVFRTILTYIEGDRPSTRLAGTLGSPVTTYPMWVAHVHDELF